MASASKTRVVFIKTLWGVSEEMGNEPNGYKRLFARIKADGFSGVETPVRLVADKDRFLEALAENGLCFVAMINTCRFPPDQPSQSLQDHLVSFEAQVKEALAFKPILINSQSGCDLWSAETSKAFFTKALEVEKANGVLVCHETHRGRILFNPWITRDMCQAFPDLSLTADLSHFCVVAERVFGPEDTDWAGIMRILAPHIRHIHARVGYSQGPQVPDPRAPEYAADLAAHEVWWDQVIETQASRGVRFVTMEPEHGTDGYQQRLPYTGVEVANLWDVNKFIRDHEAGRLSGKAWCYIQDTPVP